MKRACLRSRRAGKRYGGSIIDAHRLTGIYVARVLTAFGSASATGHLLTAIVYRIKL
jgi:hypothetical protein